MKEFLKVLLRFVPPYKRALFLTIFFNILSAILNIFSFALVIPILQILFKIQDGSVYRQISFDEAENIGEWVENNFYFLINQLIETKGASLTLLLLGLFLAFMTALKTGAYFLSSATIIPIRTGVVRDIRNLLFDKMLSLPIGFFSDEKKGDIIARMSGDVQEVESSIMSSLDMLFKNPILILSYFATLLFISWELTLFTLIVLPLMGWFMGRVGKSLKKQSLEAQNLWGETMSQVEETLGGLRVIKAFIAEKKISGRFHETNNHYRNTVSRVNTRQVLAHPMSEFLGTILIVIVLWFGGTLILSENPIITAPKFIYYLIILYSVINPLKDFSKAGYSIPKGMASMVRIDKILMAENTIKEKENPVMIPDQTDKDIPLVELRDVSFRYQQKWVLRHINLKIYEGKTIALVGQSGSGKSTLVDLIPRFWDVQEGEVLVRGVNVKDASLSRLRELMGNVNQEAILFNDTFRNNISFGVKSATDEQIIEAARIANAHDFIMDSENGYDTFIGDRGSKLSGGQRQRISIARAILKNPAILILDEATSALDTESERMVQEALNRLMRSRTTIAIAHRLSTIWEADEICVLHEGEIVERGKHDELIAMDGYYKKLCDMQQV